jgi:hypothetical protein
MLDRIPPACHIFVSGIIPGVTYGPLLSPICQPGKNGKISYNMKRTPPSPPSRLRPKGKMKKSYLASKGIRRREYTGDPAHLLSRRAKNGTIICMGGYKIVILITVTVTCL